MAYIFAAINWSTFWSSLLSAVPGLIVSLLVLRATRGINQSLEKFKSDLQQDTIKFTKWHEKRLDATAAIYNDFEVYLDFLRLALYFGRQPMSMDPFHAFQRALQRRMVFLDEQFSQKVKQYQAEWIDVVGDKGAYTRRPSFGAAGNCCNLQSRAASGTRRSPVNFSR
jgi:hypothetical protein